MGKIRRVINYKLRDLTKCQHTDTLFQQSTLKRERGTAPPLLGPFLLWPRSPISATAELLYFMAQLLFLIDINRVRRVGSPRRNREWE